VERRDLGLTGLRLPVMGIGARQAFNVFGKEGQSARRSLVDVALEEAANFFETSPEFGDADGILASSLTGRRQRAILAATLTPGDMRLAHLRIDRALRLFEERLDILMVEDVTAWAMFEPVFRHMKSDGSLLAAGISCTDPAQFPMLADLMESQQIDVIQIPYNPLRQEAASRILPLASRVGTGVIVARPFDGGALFSHASSFVPDRDLQRRGVVSAHQAVLKWILSDERVTSVVPGTRRVRHLRENLAAAAPPWLNTSERARVAAFFEW